MDGTYNTTDGDGKFSLFVRTKVLPREEILRQKKTYRNFWNEDGTPKARNRHPAENNYTLAYHCDKIVDEQVRNKFQQIRQRIKATNPALKEEYTKRRLVYWNNSNQSLYSIEPRRSSFWLGVNGKQNLSGCRKYFDQNKTFFKITNKINLENTLWTQILQK